MKKISIVLFILYTAFLTNCPAQSLFEIDPIRSSLYANLFQKGVNLFAYGENHSWSMEVVQDKTIELNIDPDVQVYAAIYEINQDSSDKSSRYFSKFADGHVQVDIQHLSCKDAGSGRTTPYSAIVHYHNTAKNNYRMLNGCVEWIPDVRLHDIWMLYEVNGELFDKVKYSQNVPRLEFHLDRMAVVGFSGSDEFEGTFDLYRNSVKINSLHVTHAHANELHEMGTYFIHLLQNNEYSFHIENGYLKLKNAQHMLTFRRTD